VPKPSLMETAAAATAALIVRHQTFACTDNRLRAVTAVDGARSELRDTQGS